MLPRLITIAGILAAFTDGLTPSDQVRNEHVRTHQATRPSRDHPAAKPRRAETIDGMLYVGVRPASHAA